MHPRDPLNTYFLQSEEDSGKVSPRLQPLVKEKGRVELAPVGGQATVSDVNADKGSPQSGKSDTKLPARI